MTTIIDALPCETVGTEEPVEKLAKRKMPVLPNARKVINEESDSLRLDRHKSVAYYGSKRSFSRGLFCRKSTPSGFSLAFFDSEEMREHRKHGGRASSIKNWLRTMGTFKGSFKTGCIFGEDFYFTARPDESCVRRKNLDGKMEKPIKVPETIARLTADSCGKNLIAVAKTGKVYMLKSDKSGWKELMTMPKAPKGEKTVYTLEDIIIEDGKVVKALLRKSNPSEERISPASSRSLCIWQSSSLLTQTKKVRAESARFVPGTDGRACCGVFFRDYSCIDMNYFSVYDLEEDQFITQPEDAIFNYENINVSSILADENWKVVIRGDDFRVKSYASYPTLYVTALQLSADEADQEAKRVRGCGG
ncbi:hypothetical protein FOL47_010117 [Perkinsus chesapeaki]|uniref:Uncharacterized protein n=1 Tax=Perkinsus chesapeaki TaxID=330153 RepID=A0A7J6L4P3_PERCH|nr:hypothetical protein FOL47_010117 [Perkinsus chesapeaki]